MNKINIKKNLIKILLTPILLVVLISQAQEAQAQSLDPRNPAASPTPEMVKATGSTQVRIVLRDDQVTRDYVRSMQNAGIRVIGIISWEYRDGLWRTGGTNSSVDSTYIQNFQRAVNDAYSTYGPLTAYQIWNEPDDLGAGNDAKKMSPQSYAQLMAAAASILDSKGQYSLSAGFVSGNPQYIQDILNSPWGFSADGVAIHPYEPNPEDPGAVDRVRYKISLLYQLLNKPVFITEFGWGTSDQQKQAAWLAAVYGLAREFPPEVLHSIMWFAWSDTQHPGMGLFDLSGQPKQALYALSLILSGQPLPPDLVNMLGSNLVKCIAPNGDFMGYMIDQSLCSLYTPCRNGAGQIIGYVLDTQQCVQMQNLQYACYAPMEMDTTYYDREVIGFSSNGENPWLLSTYTRQVFNGGDEDEWNRKVAQAIEVGYIEVAVSDFQFADFKPWVDQRWGSLDPANANYIEDKAKAVFDFDAEQNSVPVHVAIVHPGLSIPDSFQISRQPSLSDEESYASYTRRVMSAQDPTELGQKQKYANVRFIGCLQSATCNPNVENCLKPEPCDPTVAGSDCSWEARRCTESDMESPGALPCVGVGKLVTLVERDGGMKYAEPQTIHALSRGSWMATSSIARFPNMPEIAGRGQDLFGNDMPNYAGFQDKSQSTLAAQQLNKQNPTSEPKSNQGYSQTPDNPSLIKKAQAADVLPPEQLSCSNMKILVENNGDSYGVKGWTTLPEGCPDQSDFSLKIDYYLDGTRIGGCDHPIIKDPTRGGSPLPRYIPDSPNEDERWGRSLGDIQGCAVPITPHTPGKLTVSVQINNSAGEDIPGCGKTAYCNCDPNDPTCNSVSSRPKSALDCRVCNIWVEPDRFCDPINDKEIDELEECADGSCITEGVNVNFTKDDESLVDNEIEIDFNSGFFRIFRWFTGNHNFSCKIQTDYGEECAEGEADCERRGGFWRRILGRSLPECGFNARDYYLYGYVPESSGILGNLNTYRTSDDIQIYNALAQIPGQSDQFFISTPTRHPTSMQLTVRDITGIAPEERIAGCENDDKCVRFEIEGGDTRTFEISYNDQYQQMSAHCLTQAILSRDKEFPDSQAAFCRQVLGQLRDPSTVNNLTNSRFALLPENTGSAYANRQAPPSNNIANNSGQVSNIEFPTNNGESDQPTIQKASFNLQPQNTGKNHDPTYQFTQEVEVFLAKYTEKYGIEKLLTFQDENDLPEDMKNDIQTMKERFSR